MTARAPLSPPARLCDFAVGTGGIGTGMFFLLEGDHTLTRNESRAGFLLPWRDYCKQHIILHYMAVLMGGAFGVYPAGRVGNDAQGRALLGEMASAGMDIRGVLTDDRAPTLFSVCFQYPDSTGGNFTACNGASSLVTPEDIGAFLAAFTPQGRGIALAAPEVPLEARIALLRAGRERGWLTAASFAAGEAESFLAGGGLALSDVLALNRDEAAALAGMDAESAGAEGIARRAAQLYAGHNAGGLLAVTDGPRGAWACSGGKASYIPPLPVDSPASTAGAGDAFLSGTLCGLACGLPFAKEAPGNRFGDTPLDSATELGTLLASFSTTSPDTIHWGADAASLQAYASERGVPLSPRFEALLAGAAQHPGT